MASCRAETQAYRQCLKDAHASGCSNGASRCSSKAKTLESCRAKYRQENKISETKIDGTRVLPNQKCRPLNKKVQHCLKWKKGDESQCQTEITSLKQCMAEERGVVAAPTAGDKLWSDYKGS
mmetsp:Transcript_35626/g.86217  ORF Transcript_35626/g.86217 Transcript_35626/m.86217 type:complete len:122 (-) Transcript_35626:178-543(-)